MQPFEIYQYLPLYAKIAVERLDSDINLRNAQNLNQALDAYAATYGLSVDEHIRASAHHICKRRFGDSFIA